MPLFLTVVQVQRVLAADRPKGSGVYQLVCSPAESGHGSGPVLSLGAH